jgi:tetratricopeptide (TPR) repeat protein
MVDQLAADLRRGLQVSTPKGEGVERVTTSSPEAYRFYSAAMRDYEGLRFPDATRELRRSLEKDPEFALAQLRLGMSLSLAGAPEEATPWIRRAAEHAERMPERERRLAAAIDVYYGSDDPEAGEQRFEELMTLYPQDVEVHVWRAHAQASRTGDRLGAIRTLKRAHVLDPNDPLAVSALVGNLRDLELTREADAILADFLARNPSAAGAPIGEIPFRHPQRP